ncbi:MAG TPA: nucleotide sugar dehydrogenase [Solirubrobacteraceae bacterium]|nr:nucleotide sugar dehydrogenase [Solirubrobacteraceae bacterium]
MKVVVVALGKMGLPLATYIARAGHDVVGCDIDAAAVELVNAGRAPFPGEAGLDEALSAAVRSGRLRATTDTVAAVATAPDLVVAVAPLYVDERARPDWRSVDAVCTAIGRGLMPGTTVSIETTVPVGTTRGRVTPALEAGSGLRAGEDFDVVFSPERVSSGTVFRDLDTYPKLVGGLDAAGEARGVALYERFIAAEVWAMGSAESAELTKLAETTYRDLNIAYANELARYADRLGLDVQRVIDAANSQPYSHVHRPGVAVGGHCIPVYPHFLLAGDPDARLPRAGREVNAAMPAYAVDLLEQELGELRGLTILILGVAYRGGVKEVAFSGAAALRDELGARGAIALASDPLFSDAELRAAGYEPWAAGAPVAGAIVQTDHAEYHSLGPGDVGGATAVVDGRGVLDAAAFATAGIRVRRIGSPTP